MRGSGKGWLTAEYAMHPRANPERNRRDGRKGRVDGRTTEIQRLIGRSLRAIVDLDALGEQLITMDCDVLEADGGTRTAAISGSYVALALAMNTIAPNLNASFAVPHGSRSLLPATKRRPVISRLSQKNEKLDQRGWGIDSVFYQPVGTPTPSHVCSPSTPLFPNPRN